MIFKRRRLIWTGLLAGFLILIRLFRYFPQAGEWYARQVYPVVSGFFSFFSGLFPFSLGDVFILISCIGLLLYLFFYRAKSRKQRLFNAGLFLGWVYVWFYLAWGLNYFREDFFTRTGIAYPRYSEQHFKQFLQEYTRQINNDYTLLQASDSLTVEEIRRQYHLIADTFGLISPSSSLYPKTMLLSSFMSEVGVSGYMGPFFTEFQLNREILPVEYPAVYAHELAHRLSISSEAEANFYAWLTCTRSSVQSIRYSGHFLILGYVANNARRVLSAEEYREFLQTLRPEIIKQHTDYQTYWQNKYNPFIGKIQNRIYHLFLKSNRISSGTKNYSEVMGMILAWKYSPSLRNTTIPDKN